MRKSDLLPAFLSLLLLSACGTPAASSAPPAQSVPEPSRESLTAKVNASRFGDIRYLPWNESLPKYYPEGLYAPEDIVTYTFNEGTILEGSEDLQTQVMEQGKDPGLGIRALHDQGITGEGVTVAIIDQPLLLDHPEFAGKIVSYRPDPSLPEWDTSSMHGPAVASLLVGESIGVAPGARVCYAAVPASSADCSYYPYAEALQWIIQENRILPEGQKIRVVSVSAVPSGAQCLITQDQDFWAAWDEAVTDAQAEGILVLDCGSPKSCHLFAPAAFDPKDRQSPAACTGGYADSPSPLSQLQVGVPTAYRTVAEEYNEGECSYAYYGHGGYSWGIPYGAGLLALGWQVNPALEGSELIRLLLATAATGTDGSRIADPSAFLSAVQATL